MGSSGGGGGLFGDIQRFVAGIVSPEVNMAQDQLAKTEVTNAAAKASAQVAERDRKDQALKLRDEERAKQKTSAAQGQGRGSTILTSPLDSIGSVGNTSLTGGKTLLGS